MGLGSSRLDSNRMNKVISHPARPNIITICKSFPPPPSAEVLPHEEAERLNDVKFLVQQLYTTLRIEEHQLSKERELIGRLEDLNSQLRPLEKVPSLDSTVLCTLDMRICEKWYFFSY